MHDIARPVPAVVTPGPTLGAAPSDAVVLFDGSGLEHWKSGGGEARWKLADGAMEVNGTGPIETHEAFGDCQVHVE